MLNIECNGGRWPAGVKARDGRLWFPTQDGVAVIDPDAVAINAAAARRDRSVPARPRAGRAGAVRRPLRIAPGQQHFEISTPASASCHPEQVRFKYRLEGLDDDWVDAGTRRTAYYSHLPPGRVHLHGDRRQQRRGVEHHGAEPAHRRRCRRSSDVVVPHAVLVLAGAALVVLAWYRRRSRALKRAHARSRRSRAS